jgi:hypothetical protein
MVTCVFSSEGSILVCIRLAMVSKVLSIWNAHDPVASRRSRHDPIIQLHVHGMEENLVEHGHTRVVVSGIMADCGS